MASKIKSAPMDLGTLLSRIYGAASDPAQWREALGAIRSYLQAQSSILFAEDVDSREVCMSVLDRADRKLIQEYYDYYIDKSPLLKAKLAVPIGQVTATSMMMTDKEWEQHEFCHDYLRRCERFHEIGVLIHKDGSRVSVLSLLRAKRAGQFTPQDVHKFGELVPHIARAYDIGRRMHAAQAEQDSRSALLDRLTMGVILFDRNSRAIHLNRRAGELVSAADGIDLRNGEVATESPETTATLKNMLQQCIQTALGTGTGSGGGLTLVRKPPASPLTALVTPLRASAGPQPDQVCAALFLSEPSGPHSIAPDLLREWFGLTEAEALIVRELADGASPQDIAGTLNLSWHTVRTQQRAIYQKLGVSSQSQLVKTVLSSPAVMWPQGDSRP
jgi:DNA-binding CsgD family transcriptional regulator/PAS domain-containing protein